MRILLGIDAGLANLGYSLVEVHPSFLIVWSAGVIETEKEKAKRHILASDDNVRRAREIYRGLVDLLSSHNVVAICMESQSIPRNAGAAAKTGMSFGCIAALAEDRGLPIVQESPQRIKKKLCGVMTASKEDIQAAVCRIYPEMHKILEGMNKTIREHAADATAAVHAGLDSEVIRTIRKLG